MLVVSNPLSVKVSEEICSTLYIYLEIGGKRINSEKNPKNIFKLNLNDEDINNNGIEMKNV